MPRFVRYSLSRRVDCANVLLEVAQRSRDEEITVQSSQSQFMMSEPTPIQIANKLMSVKELLFENIISNMPKICACLTTSDASPDTLSDIRHPGRIVVKNGFTVARLMLIALIAEMVDWRAEEALDKIEPAVWEVFTRWFFEVRRDKRSGNDVSVGTIPHLLTQPSPLIASLIASLITVPREQHVPRSFLQNPLQGPSH